MRTRGNEYTHEPQYICTYFMPGDVISLKNGSQITIFSVGIKLDESNYKMLYKDNYGKTWTKEELLTNFHNYIQ